MNSFFTIERAMHGDLEHLTVKSKALHQRADVSIFSPEGTHENLPVVILLHGVYGSHWAWSLKGKAHEVLKKGIARGDLPPMLLVMPSDGLFQDGSGYLEHQNANYEAWIAKEVPALVQETFDSVSEKSVFFIAGLSMGGYGALRIGSKYPRRFTAFSGLSSLVNFSQFQSFVQDYAAFERSVKLQENVGDILLENRYGLRPFRFDCGQNDALYESNEKLHQLLLHHNIPHQFIKNKGTHDWDYWKNHIGDTLSFFAKYM